MRPRASRTGRKNHATGSSPLTASPTTSPGATILGVSAQYHDSAACLVRDGTILAAAQEERFTRVKHDASFPVNAIRSCLEVAGVTPEDLTHVAFYEKPFLRFDRLIETYLRFAPRGLRSFIRATGSVIDGKLSVARAVDKALEDRYDGPVYFLQHHRAHAASAFLPSPFESAAIVTIDGVGEWATTTIGRGEGNRVRLLREVRFPHSLGLLYSAFTYYLGFLVNSGEYKVMGLAPYGRPRYAELIRREVVELREDGSFRLNQRYFDYCVGAAMTNARLHALLGGPPRSPEGPLEERHVDIAASVQAVVEEAMLRLAREAHRLTGERHLCLAGGVALNCVGNGRILREGPFDDLWVQPAAGDAGGALGAALFTWHEILGNARSAPLGDAQRGSLLGPAFPRDEIRASLERAGASYREIADEGALCDETARLLLSGKVVGWFQGRMEFGPRALGARSILADPRDAAMQSRVNRKIKFREGFRPFAPVVLRERVSDWFDLDRDSPYMLLVAPVAEGRRLPVDESESAWSGDYLPRLHRRRSEIPAVTHVDYSARIQTCDAERNPLLHRLLSAWERETGCAVLLNTSFNVRGEPIVCTPEDAYACFRGTEMDALVMGPFVLHEDDQPPWDGPRGAMALD